MSELKSKILMPTLNDSLAEIIPLCPTLKEFSGYYYKTNDELDEVVEDLCKAMELLDKGSRIIKTIDNLSNMGWDVDDSIIDDIEEIWLHVDKEYNLIRRKFITDNPEVLKLFPIGAVLEDTYSGRKGTIVKVSPDGYVYTAMDDNPNVRLLHQIERGTLRILQNNG